MGKPISKDLNDWELNVLKTNMDDRLTKAKRDKLFSKYGRYNESLDTLFKARGECYISKSDLKLMLPHLSKRNKIRALHTLYDRHRYPITDYEGLWKDLGKQVNKMTRQELIRELRGFRDAWESEYGINQDLDNYRLKKMSLSELKDQIEFYIDPNIRCDVEDRLRSKMKRRHVA